MAYPHVAGVMAIAGVTAIDGTSWSPTTIEIGTGWNVYTLLV
jgi:hypothetical protein